MDIASTSPIIVGNFQSLGTQVLIVLGLFAGFALAMILFWYGWRLLKRALHGK